MAYTDRDDLNYLGQLYLIGANQTPFLSMIGGLNGGATTPSFNFPIAQPWALRTADQSTGVKSEATSVSDTTPITYTRAQDFNTCQIMKYPYAVSFAKQSTFGEIAGLAIAGGEQPVTDEMAFQRSAAMKQMAIDLEFSFLQGTYVAQSTAATVAKTRGITAAITTNVVAGGAGALTKAMIQELLVEMATSGAIFENTVIFSNAFNKQAITDIYAYAEADRNVGGVNIQQIETDFAKLGVQYDPQVPTDTLLFVEMSVCKPVFCPVDGSVITDTETAITTATKGGFVYAQVGLDYGPEEYHGKITGLATA